MKKEVWVLIFLILGIFILNYGFLDGLLVNAFLDYEIGVIERVIDGDTVVLRATGVGGKELGIGEIKVRLLGINSPEKGEVGYEAALGFLEERILGEEIVIYFDGEREDRYGRTLGYIFLDGVNVNLESVRLGYSGFYFPSGKTRYYNDFIEAWDECLDSGVGICGRSSEGCIVLDKWSDVVVLRNICSIDIDLSGWSIKDEGRKKFVFGDEILGGGEKVVISNEDFGDEYVWTQSGDSIFVRDAVGGLVIFDTY